MHCETLTHHVRYKFGERESMEILSGEIMGRLKSFTPFKRAVHLRDIKKHRQHQPVTSRKWSTMVVTKNIAAGSGCRSKTVLLWNQ
jgi:hypothetical protein